MARYETRAPSGLVSFGIACTPSQKTPASARLESGPTTATRNSSWGSSESWAMFETPPKMNSVMLLTASPRAWATNE